MTIKRLTALPVLVAAALATGPVLAGTAAAPSFAVSPPAPMSAPLAAFDPAAGLAKSVMLDPASILPAASVRLASSSTSTSTSDKSDSNDAVNAAGEDLSDLRKTLISLAMNLRDIRYVRGGHDPSTGFDCSGFVRYVFAHAIGVQLPTNSASQFLAGLKVSRADMKPGDLVFFHTGNRRRRVTHVGIYIANGQFIHAPTYGKRVQISSLDEAYWAKRFVGAKRPEGMLALSGSIHG